MKRRGSELRLFRWKEDIGSFRRNSYSKARQLKSVTVISPKLFRKKRQRGENTRIRQIPLKKEKALQTTSARLMRC